MLSTLEKFEVPQSTVRQTVKMERIQQHCHPLLEWLINQDHTKSKVLKVVSKELIASLALANISVRETTIRSILSNNNMHGRIARRKLLLSKKHMAAYLHFAKEHMDEPNGYWKNAIWMDKTKIKFSA